MKSLKFYFLISIVWQNLVVAEEANDPRPFETEITFRSAVAAVLVTPLVKSEQEKIAQSSMERRAKQATIETTGRQIREVFKEAASSIYLGPSNSPKEIFEKFPNDVPDRRFIFVVREGAFVGWLPSGATTIYVLPPVPNAIKSAFQFGEGIDKSPAFVGSGSIDEKTYVFVPLRRVDPEMVRPLLQSKLDEVLDALIKAFTGYDTDGKRVEPFISRELFLTLLDRASTLPGTGDNFKRKIASARSLQAPEPTIQPKPVAAENDRPMLTLSAATADILTEFTRLLDRHRDNLLSDRDKKYLDESLRILKSAPARKIKAETLRQIIFFIDNLSDEDYRLIEKVDLDDLFVLTLIELRKELAKSEN